MVWYTAILLTECSENINIKNDVYILGYVCTKSLAQFADENAQKQTKRNFQPSKDFFRNSYIFTVHQ